MAGEPNLGRADTANMSALFTGRYVALYIARTTLVKTEELLVMTASKQEFGWLIENGQSPVDRPLYFCGTDEGGGDVWDYDCMRAVRFAREEDASRMHIAAFHRVCEHIWG